MSLAHAVALPHDVVLSADGELVAIDSDMRLVTREHLDYDHDSIVTAAVRRMRGRYEQGPDPYRLIEEPFTLSELRHLHEAVFGARLTKDTFNRRMKPHLEEVKERSGQPAVRRSVGRPAQLYRRPRRPTREPTRWLSQLPRRRD